MRRLDSPSPNHDARPAGATIDILLLHYTGMRTAAAALERLRDAKAKVSAHYMIDEDGALHALVADDRRAWHAGESFWAGETDINARSIGIELVNPGHEFGYRAFPEAQMAALVDLAGDVIARHPIPPARVLGHSDVAPRRKQDPGELFDWARLARDGIGRWPEVPTGDSGGDAGAAEIQDLLARIGYRMPATGVFDDATGIVVAAFQRHFRPGRVDGVADAETTARMRALAG